MPRQTVFVVIARDNWGYGAVLGTLELAKERADAYDAVRGAECSGLWRLEESIIWNRAWYRDGSKFMIVEEHI